MDPKLLASGSDDAKGNGGVLLYSADRHLDPLLPVHVCVFLCFSEVMVNQSRQLRGQHRGQGQRVLC